MSHLRNGSMWKVGCFADEIVRSQKPAVMFGVMEDLGLRYYTPRFFLQKSVMALPEERIAEILTLQACYGIEAGSLGSPLGKVNLLPGYDGPKVKYVEPREYLETVARASELAEQFKTPRIRGFSFYPPPGDSPEQYLDEAAERIAQICGVLASRKQVLGLEVEANLVGRTGHLVAALIERVHQAGRPNVVGVFDGANIRVQGYEPFEVWEQYLAMKPTLGWFHVKDYLESGPVPRTPGGHVDEEAIKHFANACRGCCGYVQILRDWRDSLVDHIVRLQALGLDNVLLDLEPHLAGGGQFGGFSGVAGMADALIALLVVLKDAGVPVALRDSGYVSKKVAQLTGGAA